MKKRIIFIMLLMFLCVGCQVDYNLTINEDATVEESMRALEPAEFFESYEKSSMGRVIGFIMEPYLDTLNENNYVTKTYVSETRGGANVTKKYSSIDDYAKSTILTSPFTNNISYTKDGNKVTLIAKGKISSDTQNQDTIPIEKATISIKVPYVVSSHNADRVDNDTYIWNLTASDASEKEIKMVFDNSKLKSEQNNTLIIIGAVVVILLIIGYLLYNKFVIQKKNVNKL